MTKQSKNKHPSDVFVKNQSLPSLGIRRVKEVSVPTSVKPEKKRQGDLKKERLALYEVWTEIVRSRIDFQALSLARQPGDLFHSCMYMIQAEFGTPGCLSVTLFILRTDPKSPKKSHDELRRERKIWLLPALDIEKDAMGKENVVGISIKHATNHKFAVDPDRAFITFDIETDTVPSQADLDRLFTRKPMKAKKV